jgi:hypothetical protein
VPGGISYTPAVGFAGVATFTYTVSDGHGGSATATVSVTVPAAPGPSTLDATVTSRCLADAPFVDYAVELDGAGRALGAAAPTVSAVWRDSAGRVVATWAGLAASGTLLWPGASIGPDGRGNDWPGWVRTSGVWTPGSDGFELTRAGSTVALTMAGATATKAIAYPSASAACAARPALLAAGDSARTVPGRPVVIPTGVNDTGVDAGARVTLAAAPSHGTVVLNADGTMTYTPEPGFTGTDTYRYTVTNADGQVSTTTVTVTVQASPATDDDGPELPRTGDDDGDGGGGGGDDEGTPSPSAEDGAGPLPTTGAGTAGLLGFALVLLVVGAALRRA